MGTLIPFFRYDILARIIPGAFTLGVLAYAGIKVPPVWVAMFGGASSADAVPGSAVVVPLILAGACYAVGVLYEVAFATRPLKRVAERITDNAYDRAKAKKDEDDKALKEKKEEDSGYIGKYEIWNDLVHKDAREGERFAHAHRFQAEAKMCLHSVIPAIVLVVFACRNWWVGRCSQQTWESILAIALLVAFCSGARAREWRRWLQTLIARDYSLTGPRLKRVRLRQ